MSLIVEIDNEHLQVDWLGPALAVVLHRHNWSLTYNGSDDEIQAVNQFLRENDVEDVRCKDYIRDSAHAIESYGVLLAASSELGND